jgi:hypothetical protein
MRRKRELLLVLVLALAAAPGAMVLHLWPRQEPLLARYDRVQVGMSKDELFEVMGPSPYPSSECALVWDDGWHTVVVQCSPHDWRVAGKSVYYHIDTSCLGWLPKWLHP